MRALEYTALALIGLCAGFIIAGAVFAFIAAVGIVPRLVNRTSTFTAISVYEKTIMAGGIFGAGSMVFDYKLPIGIMGLVIVGLSFGIFLGCLAVCLAEVLNVIPIMSRRMKIVKGFGFFMAALAAGKAAGALIYFFVPGFV